MLLELWALLALWPILLPCLVLSILMFILRLLLVVDDNDNNNKNDITNTIKIDDEWGGE